MSSFNITFRRFDKTSNAQGFTYEATENPKEMEYTPDPLPLSKAGFNVHYNVQNYMAEPVLLGGNLRSSASRITSLRQEDSRFRDNINNHVLITIFATENISHPDVKKRTVLQRKIEIRVPGNMLNQGSVFISELDCYLMTESNIDPTRGLIAKDTSPHQNWDSINIPSSMSKQDPAIVYVEHKDLVQHSLQRIDQIQIRIGVDTKHEIVPAKIKSFRVAIMDSYFVPFDCYKLTYDPTLSPDELVIENLNIASKDEFRFTFSELEKLGSVYLDYEEYPTMFGRYYGMAIFADEKRHLDYVFRRKSQERFRDEQLYLAEQSGNPKLKEDISHLESKIIHIQEEVKDRDERLAHQTEISKRLKTRNKELEETLGKIRENHDASQSTEAILSELENARLKLETDQQRITQEREELRHKETIAPMTHQASVLKTKADMWKSKWGIVSAIAGGILSILALVKKYNIRLVMG